LFFPNKKEIDVRLAKHQGWQDKVYLNLVRHIERGMKRGHPDWLKLFQTKLKQSFCYYCWVVPCGNRYTWWSKQKGTGRHNWILFGLDGEVMKPKALNDEKIQEALQVQPDFRRDDDLGTLYAEKFVKIVEDLKEVSLPKTGVYTCKAYRRIVDLTRQNEDGDGDS